MPVALRTQKVETKFDVTTEFPHLGLHWAASTGDLGLVTYALENGQPVNSVIDGVLPLHAAASGGNEQVVKLLIEHGADVNAPRLPRRYSNEKRTRDTTAPIVGSTGATPLHFAAANGHTPLVRLLLQRGARGDRADKHGVTPEMLARDARHAECAALLRNWQFERERDLIERDEALDLVGTVSRTSERRPSAGGADDLSSSTSGRKRLIVKRSVERMFGRYTPTAPTFGSQQIGSPEAGASSCSDYIDYPGQQASLSNEEIAGTRRPSLPYIVEASPPPKRSRRPRSAGTGSEPGPSASDVPGAGMQQSPLSMRHKLGSKLSLLNLLRKGSEDSPPVSPADGSSSPGDVTAPAQFRDRVYSDGKPPHLPSAVEMHNAISRTRSGSGASADGSPIPGSRPSILRGHIRSSSSGQQRNLRFEPPPASPRARTGSLRTASPATRGVAALRGSGSTSSLTNIDERRRSDAVSDEEEEEEYGDQLPPAEQNTYIRAKLGRLRGPSITSSTSSLSPILSPDNASNTGTDFPFSIHQPPPSGGSEDDPRRLGVPPRAGTSTVGADARDRGGSVSSTSTNASSGGLATPGVSARLPLPAPPVIEERSSSGSFGDHRALMRGPARAPLEMDLSEISSHAQAEALVQRAQQSLLDMASAAGSAGSTCAADAQSKMTGDTPLSAKLAAYGETLALERRLKAEEEERRAATANTSPPPPPPPRTKPYGELERQGSLDRKQAPAREPPRPRAQRMRRPHTADSVDSWRWDDGAGVAPTPVERARSDQPAGRLQRLNLVDSDSDEEPVAPKIHIVETSATPLQTPVRTTPLAISDILDERAPRTKPSFSTSALPPSSTVALDDSTDTDTTDPHSLALPPLSRTYTAPAAAARRDGRASANKLARMGFATAAASPGTSSPRIASTSSGASSKRGFSGLKSLVQSLKTK